MKVSDNVKKTVPFKKDIIFKTNLSEIVSISLEHSLHLEKNSLITGEFIISGEYKMADTSIDTENFSFNLPFDINIDERYVLDNITVDIDDFYYEVINNNVLSVNIEVLIDKLEEKIIIEEPEVVIENNVEEVIEETRITESEVVNEMENVRNISNEVVEEIKSDVKENKEIINNETIKTIFDNLDEDTETYTTYQVYIVRENDSLETILQKYSTSKDELEQYNELNELKIGDKLIIPQTANAENQ